MKRQITIGDKVYCHTTWIASLESYIEAQIKWSQFTFGEGPRTEGICKHIERELAEIRAAPQSLTEWVDVMILALDGAWRSGHSPKDIVEELQRKQDVNRDRQWPPPGPQDQPIEHIRTQEP